MKTSNKLLIGLFVFIVLAMIIANIRLKKEIENAPQFKNQVYMKIQVDSASVDSIAMDSAIGNE